MGAVGFFGLVGLATEGGTWYVEKRHGQNAADAAAIAGVLALASNQSVTTSGSAAAALTGYTAGVAVTPGIFTPGSGSFQDNATPANAVKAVVTARRAPLFSGLFLDGPVTIRESAVAMMAASGPVCALAGAGGLSFGGNFSVQAAGCTLASNRTDANAISGASFLHLDAKNLGANPSLVSAGGCSGCTGLATPPPTYQPPTPDPFTATIGGVTLPNTAGTKCNDDSNVPAGYSSTSPPTINCKGFRMTGKHKINLLPGTYIFNDSDIRLDSGNLGCSTCTGVGASGVTIIMTGSSASKIGAIEVNGDVTIHLVAPATSGFNAAFDGVLFYTDRKAPVGNSVKLAGAEDSTLAGIMYFPSSSVTFMGNSGVASPACIEIIGWSLSFVGNAGFDITGCPAKSLVHAQVVRMAQ